MSLLSSLGVCVYDKLFMEIFHFYVYLCIITVIYTCYKKYLLMLRSVDFILFAVVVFVV